MPRATRIPLGWWLGLLTLTAASNTAVGQTPATYTWNRNAITSNWLDPTSWTDGNAGRTPGATASGLSTQGTATDVARFNNFPQGPSNGLGIDFGAAGGTLSVGAVHFDRGFSEGLAIGNSSTTTPGVLRLNGATVAGVSNVLVAVTNESYGPSFFQNAPSHHGGPGMTLQLGQADGVFLLSSGSLWVNVPITEAAPGSGFTVRGGLELSLQQSNTFSGPVRVVGSILNINADDRLGLAPASPTPNHLVLQPDAAGVPAVLDTNAATFEIHQNRGIAIGPTSGTGAAEIFTPAPDGSARVVTYNGVIADNASGSGRLVKTGGGVLALGGAGTFTGGTLIRGGTVQLTNPLGLGSTGIVTIATAGMTEGGFPLPAALLVQSAGTFARPVVVNATTFPNGSPHIGAVSIGTPDFTAAAETVFSGPITLNRPVTLQAGNAHADGTWFTGPIAGTGDVTVSSPSGLARTMHFLRTGAANSFGDLTIGANTTLRLSNGFNNLANRYVPDTSSVTFAAGARLQLSPEGIDNEAVSALRSAAGGTGVVETVSGGSNLFTLSVGAGNGSGAFGGVIQQGANGARILLVKAGTGTQTLSGANTYTGGTTVDQGTLLVTNTTGSATGTAGVTVNAGGTLGGTGRVAPGPAFAAVPVVLNGGAVQAGGTATAAPTRTDVLTITQGLTFDGASTLRSTVGQTGGVGSAGKIDMTSGFIDRNTAGASNDELTIRLTNDGTLDLSGTSTYTVTVLSSTGFGIGSGLTPFTNQADPDYFAVSAENFSFASPPLISLNNGALSVTFTPVPEPGLGLAAAVAGLVLARRRRHPASTVG